MNQNPFSGKWSYLCILCLTVVVISVSCGGGTPSSPYNGLTTQAAITSGNGETMAAGSYNGGYVAASGAISITGVNVQTDNIYNGQSLPLQLTELFEESLSKIDWSSQTSRSLSGILLADNGTVQGACGGSASYSGTYDNVTGDFTVSVTYNNYCSNN